MTLFEQTSADRAGSGRSTSDRRPPGFRGAGVIATIVFSSFLLTSCGEPEEPAVRTTPPKAAVPAPPVHSPAETYLASTAGPWTRNGLPRSYSAASLPQYLGVEATRWRVYDVVDVAVASYGAPPDRFAIAEIFRFRSDREAFAAYSVRRDANRNFAEIPDEAFRTRNSVVIWRGAAVVRVIGPESGDHGPIDALARAIVQPMAQSAGRPAGFEMFPSALLIPRSEVLTREPAFGYEFLRNSMMVRFNVGTTGVEGMIHTQATIDETQNAFQQYRQSVGRSAKTLDPVLKLGDEGFFAQDPMLGNIVAFRSGLSLVIYRGNARPEALIDLATATDARIRGKQQNGSSKLPVGSSQ